MCLVVFFFILQENRIRVAARVNIYFLETIIEKKKKNIGVFLISLFALKKKELIIFFYPSNT